MSGRPVNGSLPLDGGFTPDGGGLTKVTPNTVGVTEGLVPVVSERVGVAVAETLAVTVGVLVDVAEAETLAVTVGVLVDVAVAETLGDALGVHILLLGLTVVNAWAVGLSLALGLSGTGSGAEALPGLAVTVITMLSDTWRPCARASAPSDSVAAPALAALSKNVRIEARRRDRTFVRDAGITS